MAAISLILWCIKRSKTTSKMFWKLYFTSHVGEGIQLLYSQTELKQQTIRLVMNLTDL